MTTTAQNNAITLRGSCDIVTEFFGYAINSIIYQRGLCPPEWFKKVPKYGIALYVPGEQALTSYIMQVMEQVRKWLLNNDVEKLVLVVTGLQSQENLERWVFTIDTSDAENKDQNQVRAHKSEKEISKEIAAIMRQITNSVSWMPMIEEECSFDLLVYTRESAEVPSAWEESDPKYISNSEEVALRNFTTKVHKVSAVVSYRQVAEDEDNDGQDVSNKGGE